MNFMKKSTRKMFAELTHTRSTDFVTTTKYRDHRSQLKEEKMKMMMIMKIMTMIMKMMMIMIMKIIMMMIVLIII
jgi:hypothetical protein